MKEKTNKTESQKKRENDEKAAKGRTDEVGEVDMGEGGE